MKQLIWSLFSRSLALTSSMDWSSTILHNRAPTKESPAPVVSTVLTWKASTDPWKFWFVQKREQLLQIEKEKSALTYFAEHNLLKCEYHKIERVGCFFSYLGVVPRTMFPKSDKEQLQIRVPQWESRFIINLVTSGEEFQFHITHLDHISLVPYAQYLLTRFLRWWPQG